MKYGWSLKSFVFSPVRSMQDLIQGWAKVGRRGAPSLSNFFSLGPCLQRCGSPIIITLPSVCFTEIIKSWLMTFPNSNQSREFYVVIR